jgi:hypothetical protein
MEPSIRRDRSLLGDCAVYLLSTLDRGQNDISIHDVFQRLLHTSGHWAATAAVQRGETKRQTLEIIERVIELLAS